MLDKQKLLYDLFRAYYDARRNKRNTLNQLDFEYSLEENLIKLYHELMSGEYNVGRSIYFIQNLPVKREIFAGDFRDRVVHHLVYNYISPIFEKEFIYDSYSCRKFKGTSFGVKRIEKFMRSCSENYTKDCYVLKLDISGYFMSMNKNILFEKVKNSLHNRELQVTYNFLIDVIEKIIFNDPTKNGIFKGKRSDYVGLPKNKSLFFAKKDCGLPIGNLTSQLFSNIYLKDFDTYIKKDLGVKYYGRYVDDFVIIHEDKNHLKKIITYIDKYLQDNLGLNLHPKKTYLQHYSKGVLFLGVFIKPYRTYIRKRSIGYLYVKIQILNKRLADNNFKLDEKLKQDFLSVINSYLGLFGYHKTYKKRKHLLLKGVNAYFWNYFYISGNFAAVKRKRL